MWILAVLRRLTGRVRALKRESNKPTLKMHALNKDENLRIYRCTFTGADKKTDLTRLASLAKDQRIEFGILYSRSSTANRFPRPAWLESFYSKEIPYKAAHLCGQYVREVIRGNLDLDVAYHYDRIQWNFHAEPLPADHELAKVLEQFPEKEFIFQMDGVNNSTFHQLRSKYKNIYPLHDLSHGEGVLPENWDALIPGVHNAYAGGLGPHNLEEQLRQLEKVVGDTSISIDMETWVRDEKDWFDLDKVAECFEMVKKYF